MSHSISSIPAPVWLSEKAVAAITGLSVHTLRAHRQHRTGIPYAKIGRSVRYAIDDIQAFMDKKRIHFSFDEEARHGH